MGAEPEIREGKTLLGRLLDNLPPIYYPYLEEQIMKREKQSPTEILNSLLEEMERIKPQKFISYRITDLTKKTCEKLKKIKEKEIYDKCRWEHTAFSFVAMCQQLFAKSEVRFAPMFQIGGESFPDINKVPPAAFNYYKERLDQTQNPTLIARYADLLFEFGNLKGKEKHKIANKAIRAYIEQAKLLEKVDEAELDMIGCYDRAVTLCLEQNDKKLGQRTVDQIIETLNRFFKDERFRWILELTELLCAIRESRNLNALVADDTVQKLITIQSEVREKFRKDNNFDMERATLNILARLEKMRGEKGRAIKFREAIAKSFENQVETMNPSGLLKAAWLEDALRVYIDIGQTEKTKELKAKIREAYAQAQREKEFKGISTKIEIPREELDKIYEQFLSQPTLTDSLKLLAISPDLIPSLKEARKEVKKQAKIYPLTDFIQPVILTGDRKDEVPPPEEFHVRNNLMMKINFIIHFLIGPIIARLWEKKGLNANELTQFFESWELMDPGNLSVLEVGFRRFFEKDLVSTLYVLTPQFESILRKMLAKGGIDITVYKHPRGEFEEQTLGDILRESKISGILGEDLTYYYRVIMVEKGGFNLRNRVAHGFLTKADCHPDLAVMVIHALLTLTRFRLKKG